MSEARHSFSRHMKCVVGLITCDIVCFLMVVCDNAHCKTNCPKGIIKFYLTSTLKWKDQKKAKDLPCCSKVCWKNAARLPLLSACLLSKPHDISSSHRHIMCSWEHHRFLKLLALVFGYWWLENELAPSPSPLTPIQFLWMAEVK